MVTRETRNQVKAHLTCVLGHIHQQHIDESMRTTQPGRESSYAVNTLYEAHCCRWLESSNMATNSSMSVLRTLCSRQLYTEFLGINRQIFGEVTLNQIAESKAYIYQ